jgi:hypothetical protein
MSDAIALLRDRKKDVESVYLAIDDADVRRGIDRLTFHRGKAEISRQNWWASPSTRAYSPSIPRQELSMVSPELQNSWRFAT